MHITSAHVAAGREFWLYKLTLVASALFDHAGDEPREDAEAVEAATQNPCSGHAVAETDTELILGFEAVGLPKSYEDLAGEGISKRIIDGITEGIIHGIMEGIIDGITERIIHGIIKGIQQEGPLAEDLTCAARVCTADCVLTPLWEPVI